MISNQDRSYYIGASDTSSVIRPWNTRSFEQWWREKQGFPGRGFQTDATLAGTFYEHRILQSLDIPGLEVDKQKIIGHLRVNLDGNTTDTIYEVKTYRHEKGFKVSAAYRRQVNVEMYAFNIFNAYIVAYGLKERDYNNYFSPIEKERLNLIKIDYDEDFIHNEYLPRMKYLSHCLDKGKFPNESEVEEWNLRHCSRELPKTG